MTVACVVALGACVPPIEGEMPCAQCMAKSDFAGVWLYRIEPLDADAEAGGAKGCFVAAFRRAVDKRIYARFIRNP